MVVQDQIDGHVVDGIRRVTPAIAPQLPIPTVSGKPALTRGGYYGGGTIVCPAGVIKFLEKQQMASDHRGCYERPGPLSQVFHDRGRQGPEDVHDSRWSDDPIACHPFEGATLKASEACAAAPPTRVSNQFFVGGVRQLGCFCQSSRGCVQDGRAARATRSAVEVLLRSWTLRLWPASVLTGLGHACSVVAPSLVLQSGGSDQNGPARFCDVGKASPRRRAPAVKRRLAGVYLRQDAVTKARGRPSRGAVHR
jgi:hypothetical protein